MRCVAALLLLAVVGCEQSAPVGGPAHKIDPKEPDHRERELVRAYLKENTDSGVWEEVKWWEPRIIKNGMVQGLVMVEDEKFIRVKYRSVSHTGQKALSDRILSVEAAHASAVHSDIEVLVRKAFPDHDR